MTLYLWCMEVIQTNIWEEKDLTEQKKNCLNSNANERNVIINGTETDSIQSLCDDITKRELKRLRRRKYHIKNKEKENRNSHTYYKNHSPQLKQKASQYYALNRDKIKEREKQYRKENKDKIQKTKKQYYEKNKIKLLKYRENNKDKKQKYDTQYRKNHTVQKREYDRQYQKEKNRSNVLFRISSRLRQRLNKAIRGTYKSGSAVRDLGCSITDFKQYVEKKFQSDMTWNNYGRQGWHLDHIIPLSNFNLQDRRQLLIALNYTNYQPLWATDNIRKSNKLPNLHT